MSPAEPVTNSKKDEFLASLASSREESEMVEPMTAKAVLGRSKTWGMNFDDAEAPMSPLLRRRKENFAGDTDTVRNRKKDASRFATSPGNMGLCSPTGALSLKTVKFDKLDLVPPSPKRIPPTPGKRKAVQDAQWATPIVEEDKDEQQSP